MHRFSCYFKHQYARRGNTYMRWSSCLHSRIPLRYTMGFSSVLVPFATLAGSLCKI